MHDLAIRQYWKVHQRLAVHNGKAANFRCKFCGEQATDWAYNRQDPNEKKATNERGQKIVFSVQMKFYIPLCKSCHCGLDANLDHLRASALLGAHTRWHVNRGMTARDCWYCRYESNKDEPTTRA